MSDPNILSQWQIPVRSTLKHANYSVSLEQFKDYPAYTHFVSGWDNLSFADNKLQYSGLWYREFNSDRTSPSWTLKEIKAGLVELTPAQRSESCLFILATGGAIQLSSIFPAWEDLATKICLGVVTLSSGAIASVKRVLIENNPFNNSSYLLYHGGIVNRSLHLSPKLGTRSLSIPAGEIEVVGSNYFADPTVPHKYTVPFQDVVNYDLCTPDGTVITADATELDFSQIWDGTTVQPVQSLLDNDSASVVHFYYCPYRSGNKTIGVIGTIDYSSIGIARRDWRDLEQHTTPAWLIKPSVAIAVAVGMADYDFADNKARVTVNKI